MNLRAQFEIDNLLTLLLTFLFLSTGIAKITSYDFVVATFNGWNQAPWMLTALGTLEIAAAIMVLIPTSRSVGACALATLMLGALGYHIFRQEWALLPLPMTLLVILGSLLRLEWALTRGATRAFQTEE